MSLYNMLFGVHPTAGIALAMLEIDANAVPRFRDAYFAWSDETRSEPVIVIHTRTGGGNRKYYDAPNEDNPEGPWNSGLKALPGYRNDADDEFDSTYADFYFNVPEAEQGAVVKFLTEHGQPPSSKERWEAAIAAISSKGDRNG